MISKRIDGGWHNESKKRDRERVQIPDVILVWHLLQRVILSWCMPIIWATGESSTGGSGSAFC